MLGVHEYGGWLIVKIRRIACSTWGSGCEDVCTAIYSFGYVYTRSASYNGVWELSLPTY